MTGPELLCVWSPLPSVCMTGPGLLCVQSPLPSVCMTGPGLLCVLCDRAVYCVLGRCNVRYGGVMYVTAVCRVVGVCTVC